MQIARWGLLAGVLSVSWVGGLPGGEIDELRTKAKQLQKDAEAQSRNGNLQAAAELKQKSHELRQEADQLERATRLPELQRRRHEQALQQLLRDEQKLSEANAPPDALQEVRNRIADLKRQRPPQDHPASGAELKLDRAAQRLRHLREAAENLKLAEAHDLAHEVLKHAEAQEQQLADIKRHLADQRDHEHPDHSSSDVQELKSEVERLRAEVQELRQTLEKRP